MSDLYILSFKRLNILYKGEQHLVKAGIVLALRPYL